MSIPVITFMFRVYAVFERLVSAVLTAGPIWLDPDE